MIPCRGHWNALLQCAAGSAIAIGTLNSPATADVQYEELPGAMPAVQPAPPGSVGAIAGPTVTLPGSVIVGDGPPPVTLPVGSRTRWRTTLPWSWQLLPSGLIWHSYLAGVKEPRMATVWNYQPGVGWLWSAEAGGRVGLLRYGTPNSFRPEGWQLDIEGAAFPELNISNGWTMRSTDFRVGMPLTYGVGRLQMKFAVYHISSHAGDQFLLANPTFEPVEYSRNAGVRAELLRNR